MEKLNDDQMGGQGMRFFECLVRSKRGNHYIRVQADCRRQAVDMAMDASERMGFGLRRVTIADSYDCPVCRDCDPMCCYGAAS